MVNQNKPCNKCNITYLCISVPHLSSRCKIGLDNPKYLLRLNKQTEAETKKR